MKEYSYIRLLCIWYEFNNSLNDTGITIQWIPMTIPNIIKDLQFIKKVKNEE